MIKCLVLDLDNTIWGGVCGEEDIVLSPEYLAVQQAALDAKSKGLLLALCSKNNLADVEKTFQIPGMLLKLRDFAASAINWEDKPTNLGKIAAQLNIGIDSLAFVDDRQSERGLVRYQFPEITILDAPPGFATAVAIGALVPGVVTEEDAQRGHYYAEQKARLHSEKQFPSREEFLRSLRLELVVGVADAATAVRVSQLSQRTNQFNTSGERYSESDILSKLADSRIKIYWGRLRDKFGDYGIIAAAITRRNLDIVWITDLYLSCRALGLGIEKAFLAALVKDAAAGRVVGSFKSTDRNAAAENFYPGCGFDKEYGLSAWSTTGSVVFPDYISLNMEGDLDILERTKAVACEKFGLPTGIITAESSPENTESWDSLAALDLMLALEEEFEVVFTAEEMEVSPNIGQIAEMICHKIAK